MEADLPGRSHGLFDTDRKEEFSKSITPRPKSLALELVRRTPMRQLRIDRTIWTTRKCDDELILLTSASLHISDTFASV